MFNSRVAVRVNLEMVGGEQSNEHVQAWLAKQQDPETTDL